MECAWIEVEVECGRHLRFRISIGTGVGHRKRNGDAKRRVNKVFGARRELVKQVEGKRRVPSDERSHVASRYVRIRVAIERRGSHVACPLLG